MHTEMTLRKPSRTSRSCLLSSSFLTDTKGVSLVVFRELGRELLADWAASRVKSRANELDELRYTFEKGRIYLYQ